jgi:DNA-binding response OmpR family regulator
MHVLIADDERATAQLLSTRIASAGYRTTVAFDTMQTMMMCMKLRPDAVVLDVQMPGGSGLQVLHRLKSSAHTAMIPVIVLTGNAEHENAALQQGADAFLLKPPDFERLFEILERCAARVDSPRPRIVHRSPQPKAESLPPPEALVRNVLVIDDDIVVSNVIANGLLRAGFATMFAADIPEALRVLKAFRIDAVVLDLELPSGSGLEVIRRLKSFSRRGEIPILVVSGSTGEQGARVALAAGADRFLTKPPDPELLVAHLRVFYPATAAQQALEVTASR